jgi:hypothetical protein
MIDWEYVQAHAELIAGRAQAIGTETAVDDERYERLIKIWARQLNAHLNGTEAP